MVNRERKDGRREERNENRGPRDQTVTSNKALFTKNTHLLPSSLLPGRGGVKKQQRCLPPPPSHECQASDQGDSANSCLGLLGLGHKHSTHRSPGETEWEGDP